MQESGEQKAGEWRAARSAEWGEGQAIEQRCTAFVHLLKGCQLELPCLI